MPAELGIDSSIVLTAHWTIYDACVLAREAVPEPSITFATEDDTVSTWLGDRGVAAFTRYAAAECAE